MRLVIINNDAINKIDECILCRIFRFFRLCLKICLNSNLNYIRKKTLCSTSYVDIYFSVSIYKLLFLWKLWQPFQEILLFDFMHRLNILLTGCRLVFLAKILEKKNHKKPTIILQVSVPPTFLLPVAPLPAVPF